MIRCEDWPACPSGRRFPRTPETVIPKAESEALQARRHFRGLGQQLEQITQDHSLVEEQIRDGRMTRSEAMRSPLRNIITRALGTQGHVTADVFPLEVEAGDLFLLSSDGLTRELSDAKIQTLLNSGDPLEDQCNRLVEAAKKSGGNDNITCLLLRADA